ncbi:hypothetical protein DFH08DRAFT_809936 [Mycena albidolilacea]|uniref:Uncharacterized protein n=1 Tax=Mycena albidolilacea TaxID=1033008 RepID=A0AAD7ERH0_9AGAR|nr:hypothetical protein DFH08DRAFT_809936 [Mycena albidolilacea]
MLRCDINIGHPILDKHQVIGHSFGRWPKAENGHVMCGVTGEVAAFQSLFCTTTKMSHIERRNDEQMPEEPTPRGGNPLPDSDNELARRAPEELMPSGVPEPDDQPMPSSALPPDNADLARRARSPPNNELARRAPEELTPSGVPEPDDQPMPSSALPPDNADLARRARSPPNNELARRAPEELTPSGVPEPDNQPTDLARRACTPLFLPDSRGPTPFAFSQSNFDDFRRPTPIPSRVPPEVDASRKRARSNSVEPPPSKRRKPRSVARFLDLAAEEDEDSGDDDAPRGVRRATLAEDGEDDGDDDEETRSDLEFIDDEPVHQGSHFLIPEETDAAALEALAASFKAAPALSLDPSTVATSAHDDSVLNLFQPNAPAPSDAPATVQRGEWIRLKKKPYEGKIAWVVSSQRFIVANLTTFGEEDSCSRLKYDSPLHASAYPRVLPNPYELLPFKQTGESYLKKATFIGTAPALVEGTHVVVVAGEHEGYVGYIIIIREIADGKHVARWAKIQENYNGTDTVHAKTPGIEAQILHLRRHALDPPTPFRVLDRVQVVTGIEHRGAIGRIVQVEDEWLRVQCLPESGEHNIIEVEHRRVTRYFMEGDFVCVTSGPTERRGLVVKGRQNFDGSDDYDDPLWRAPSRDVNFDLNPDSSMSSWAALMPQPDPTRALRSAMGHDLEKQRREGKHDGSDFNDVLRLAVDEDLKKQRRLREGRPVGRRYEGIEVKVVRQGPFKGTQGIVIGDFDGPGRAKRIQKCKHKYQVQDDDGIMVTVQKEGSNEKFTVDIKRLVHVHTYMPLSKTQAVPDWMLVRWPAPQPARARTPLPPSRSPTPPPQASWTLNSQTLDGDFGAPTLFKFILTAHFQENSTADGSVFPGSFRSLGSEFSAAKADPVILPSISPSAKRISTRRRFVSGLLDQTEPTTPFVDLVSGQ